MINGGYLPIRVKANLNGYEFRAHVKGPHYTTPLNLPGALLTALQA